MLSRTADTLYWIARYTQRAETAARLPEVGARIALLPSADGYGNDRHSLLRASGNADGFSARYGKSEFGRQLDGVGAREWAQCAHGPDDVGLGCAEHPVSGIAADRGAASNRPGTVANDRLDHAASGDGARCS